MGTVDKISVAKLRGSINYYYSRSIYIAPLETIIAKPHKGRGGGVEIWPGLAGEKGAIRARV